MSRPRTKVWYTGDTKPDLQVTLSNATGDALDATTASSVRVIGLRSGAVIFDKNDSGGDVTVAVDGNSSIVTMLWANGDLDTAGPITVEVEVTWSLTQVQTFRAQNTIDVRVDFDAA